jgi:hypothetical protein
MHSTLKHILFWDYDNEQLSNIPEETRAQRYVDYWPTVFVEGYRQQGWLDCQELCAMLSLIKRNAKRIRFCEPVRQGVIEGLITKWGI